MKDLLPATQELLLELLGELDAGDTHLPEVRVGAGGRSGSRYWLRGRQPRAFEGRRPPAQFDELRSAGYLRWLRADSSGTYFAFTPAAFQLRDQLNRPEPRIVERVRPAEPPPEFAAAGCLLDQLGHQFDMARESLQALAEASSISTFRDDPSSGVFFVPTNPFSWDELHREDIPLLGAARENGERWLASARRVLAIAASEHLEEFDESADEIRSVYIRGQSGAGPRSGTPAGVIDELTKSFDRQLKLIQDLPGAVEPPHLFVLPDTNALLQDPALEEWTLGDEEATVLIPHEVMSELDQKKIEGNGRVAGKADSIIRRFKEYGRRGDTLSGVKLVRETRFRELPLAPDMTVMPRGLDSRHADDRILATVLHVAAMHLSSRVILVTRDRNLQNKARLLGLPAVDVADL